MEARPPRARSSDRPLGVQARVRLSLAALVLVAAAVLGAQWHIASSFDHTAPATHPAARWLLLGVGLLGLLVAAGVGWLAVTLAVRPLRSLSDSAREMTRDLSGRARDEGDEVGTLAGALDALADNLAESRDTLGRERDRLGAILEAMAEGVLVTDAAGSVVLANRAVREMFFVGRDVVGRAPIEALRSAEMHEMLGAVHRGGAPVTREIAVGGARPRKVTARVAAIDAPGAGAVVVLSDVTELRRLESVRRDFVANVSHELRTPVAAIRAASETLLMGAMDRADTTHEFVGIIDRHAMRLHRLVEDLLELSRIESREVNLNPLPLDLYAEVERAKELLALAAQARGTRVENLVPRDLPRVEADRAGLEHVLTNLVDNALKYSPEHSTVTVRAELSDTRRVRLSVEDNGAGIEARHLPRLFERFYRVDTGRSRALGGTGLGLAIVKHLVEAMRGTVTVESALGKGSVFHVTLHVYGMRSTPAPPPVDRPERAGEETAPSLPAVAASVTP